MNAICVDGGMIYGSRAFLEIGVDGKFLSHENIATDDFPQYQVRDLSSEFCLNSSLEPKINMII
jgi:hypothetical protein